MGKRLIPLFLLANGEPWRRSREAARRRYVRIIRVLTLPCLGPDGALDLMPTRMSPPPEGRTARSRRA